jgi:hypothetical protein
MKVGKAYPAKIEIKNTGDTRTTYYIALSSDKFIIFVDKPVIATITLDGGTTGTLQYNLVPFKEYAGELPVGLEVYIIPENLPPDAALDLQYENWARQRMDSVTAVVNRIVL